MLLLKVILYLFYKTLLTNRVNYSKMILDNLGGIKNGFERFKDFEKS